MLSPSYLNRNYEKLALSILLLALDDYKFEYRKEDCEEFLFEDIFSLCCALLNVDEDVTRDGMFQLFKESAAGRKFKKKALKGVNYGTL